ncbi:hypothetical protein BKA00_003505 [Actinomadura coerulea]|uniref:Uncharacterized protein n=1 Tax=Actinomadura coerulea TaxID=46159 RepID=A0A7X0FZL5_9ACTN|nr:hypothetical protein [Actinomadura coerulea]MBB6396591.1 hypothetical protein [Actinomadura coerulea]
MSTLDDVLLPAAVTAPVPYRRRWAGFARARRAHAVPPLLAAGAVPAGVAP